jgi:hypothetical protein
LRSSVVTAADTYIKTNPPPTGSNQTNPQPAASPSPSPTTQNQTSGATNQSIDPEEQAKTALKKVNDIREEINTLGLPIGWAIAPVKEDDKYKNNQALYEQDLAAYRVDPRRFPDKGYGWLLKVLGIFLTALAVSQGAPFWFDVLNKFIVIRSTVKPHEKSPEQPSKDKPAPETTKKPTENSDHTPVTSDE